MQKEKEKNWLKQNVFFHIIWKTDVLMRLANMDKNFMSRMRSGQCHFWSASDKKTKINVLLGVCFCRFLIAT